MLHDANEKEAALLEERWLSEECMQAIMTFMQRKSKLWVTASYCISTFFFYTYPADTEHMNLVNEETVVIQRSPSSKHKDTCIPSQL